MALILALLFALAWCAYYPGLRGPFLFDDFANLPAIGATGPVDDWPTFWRYVTSGTADPTGRPIALLSFLIDARDWPAAAWAFKRDNVVLHLINGGLLIWLLQSLGRSTGISESRNTAASLLAGALWLLHPLLVSTTLYVVQREAMLPGTFVLLGLIGYLTGRNLSLRGSAWGAWIAGASIALGTLFGVLSKANGALLPMLAWLIESILLARKNPITASRRRSDFARMRGLALIAPSVILLGYLAKQTYSGIVNGFDLRPWTLGERLLTECRVLVDYLSLLWLPRAATAGVFSDAYPVSTSLWSPGTTFPCMMLVLGLIGAAIATRKHHTYASLAILFFFVAHLMESSVLPLELYFEHRNYIPAMLMFWPLALWLCRSLDARHSDRMDDMRIPRLALALILPLMLATLTALRADLWGNSQEQAIIWAAKNPASPRAQAYAAQIEMAAGKNEAAAQRLTQSLLSRPDDTQLALNLIGARCALGQLSSDDIESARSALEGEPNTGRLGYEWFERSLPQAVAGTCVGLDLGVIEDLLAAAANNPRAQKIPGRRQDVLHMKGRVALLNGNAELALRYFNQALDADFRPGAALNQAAILGSAGHPRLGLDHLGYFEARQQHSSNPSPGMPQIHQWVLKRQGYWLQEIRILKDALEADYQSSNPELAPISAISPLPASTMQLP